MNNYTNNNYTLEELMYEMEVAIGKKNNKLIFHSGFKNNLYDRVTEIVSDVEFTLLCIYADNDYYMSRFRCHECGNEFSYASDSIIDFDKLECSKCEYLKSEKIDTINNNSNDILYY